jgi:hypothetical protein
MPNYYYTSLSMARIEFREPPRLGAGANYSRYKSWLLDIFFKNLCSYCLIQHESLDVEHYEPKDYAPEKIHHPDNLLLACRRCNGPGGKGDYHPQHRARRRLPHDRTGFFVLDVRNENFAELFKLDSSGELKPREGMHAKRAAWNIVLLKLDIDFLVSRRQRILEKLSLCEQLLLNRGRTIEEQAKIERLIDVLVRDLGEQFLLLHAFNVEISPALHARIQKTISSAAT